MKEDDYRSIISFAIGNEIEAYNFYKSVAEKISDDNLKFMFLDLAEEEKHHRTFLENLLSRAIPVHIDPTIDYGVSKTIETPKLSISMKPADSIALAIKKEEEAMVLYTNLAKSATEADRKETFESLANMEQHHKVRLEEIYTTMAFPEVW